MGWITITHQFFIYTEVSAINRDVIISGITSHLYNIYLMNGMVAVDSFLLISGLLLSYVFLKTVTNKKTSSFNIPLFYFHRYIRLTPAFAAMILLQVGVLPRLGSGPMFGGMYNKTINACDQYWWAALLYFHNFLKPKNMCLGQTWYLSLDMQLYLLSPLILIPLWKKPKFGLYLLGFLMVLGPSISFAIAYTHQLLPTFFEILEDARNGELFAYYTPPVRFTPWILGIFLGYVLHKTKNHKPLLSKPVVIVGWVGNILMMLAAQYLIYPIQQPDYVYDRLVCSFYFALFRTCWALGVAWIVFACVTGYGGPVNTLLSWKGWIPLSRLTYCIYLVHLPLVRFQAYSNKIEMYMDISHQSWDILGSLIIITTLAALLSLVFESPIISIEKALLGKGRTKTWPQSSKNYQHETKQSDINENINLPEL